LKITKCFQEPSRRKAKKGFPFAVGKKEESEKSTKWDYTPQSSKSLQIPNNVQGTRKAIGLPLKKKG